jgi:hypothetical protein
MYEKKYTGNLKAQIVMEMLAEEKLYPKLRPNMKCIIKSISPESSEITLTDFPANRKYFI